MAQYGLMYDWLLIASDGSNSTWQRVNKVATAKEAVEMSDINPKEWDYMEAFALHPDDYVGRFRFQAMTRTLFEWEAI